MSKPARFVTATCACGATFEREVKRGRPQKWCAACTAVPFYERVAVEAPVPAAEGGEPDAPKAQWDDLGEFRSSIEEEMAVVNAEHKARFAALVADGVDKYEAAGMLDEQLREAIKDVYSKYRRNR